MAGEPPSGARPRYVPVLRKSVRDQQPGDMQCSRCSTVFAVKA